VTEHRLHGFEVVASGETGRVVVQVMQPDRRQIGVVDQLGQRLCDLSG
jgi:hypothetical protein